VDRNNPTKLVFQIAVGDARFVADEIGSLHQRHIEAGWWVLHQSLRQSGFSSVRTEVARVEDTLAMDLDEQHVGVRDRMVGQ
jgi:hypothetical protein